jgi:formylglycine-generating enzyme required for sulfatase activity
MMEGKLDRRTQLTRREFLRVAGIALPAALGAACAPKLVATLQAPSPTLTPPPARPSATAEPTRTPASAIEPEMILVEPGSFEMGAANDRPEEGPVHAVRITRPFRMSIHEVIFEQYDLFSHATGAERADDMGFGRGRLPVIGVDWYDATAYCNWLSAKHSLTPCYSGKGKGTACDFSADGYRLPTEAEWEYAARGGPKAQGFIFAGGDDPVQIGWHAANSGDHLHAVGELAPNELGLYDMCGNAFEWCWDWYAVDYYASSPTDDPQGPPAPATQKPWELIRARRSGCWREAAQMMRVTSRSYDTASYPGENGFRLVRTA